MRGRDSIWNYEKNHHGGISPVEFAQKGLQNLGLDPEARYVRGIAALLEANLASASALGNYTDPLYPQQSDIDCVDWVGEHATHNHELQKSVFTCLG